MALQAEISYRPILPIVRCSCDNGRKNGIAMGTVMEPDGLLSLIRDNLDVVVTVASAFVAVIGALASRGETRRQRKLQQAAVRLELDRQSLEWGHEVIDSLAEAGGLAGSALQRTQQDFALAQGELAARLSGLADRGRLFFPNLAPETLGQGNESAYKGHRPPALVSIVFASYAIESLRHGDHDLSGQTRAFLFKCRRLFVSELQAYLDPRQRNVLAERDDHLPETQRSDAVHRAGRLGVELNCYHPGLLESRNDTGIIKVIGAEERKSILHDIETGTLT